VEALKKGALEVLARKYDIPAETKVAPQKSQQCEGSPL
jgi:hypothetical protein